MVSFKNRVSEILAAQAILSAKPNSHSNPSFHLDLFEHGKDATLKQLKLTHIRDSDTCITFDVADGQKFKTYSAYLKSSKKHCFNKRCDFIIARKEGDEWQVYFGDLKSTRIEPSNILKQLLASQLFFDYILKIIRLEFGNDELSNYVAKFVCIHDNKAVSPLIQRSPTIPGNSKSYTKKIDSKKLTIMPVVVLPDGRAQVSFNKITG